MYSATLEKDCCLCKYCLKCKRIKYLVCLFFIVYCFKLLQHYFTSISAVKTALLIMTAATAGCFYYERVVRKRTVWSRWSWLRWFIKAESCVESGVNVGRLWRLTALTQQPAGLYNESPAPRVVSFPPPDRSTERQTKRPDTFLSRWSSWVRKRTRAPRESSTTACPRSRSRTRPSRRGSSSTTRCTMWPSSWRR